MADNEDGLNAAPWYIAFFVRVGLPTAFAAVLLWFLLTNVTKTLSDIHGDTMALAHNDTMIVQNQKQIIQLLVDHASSVKANTGVLVALCINQAKDETTRNRCAEAMKN
jgi:hypothetical protein